MQFTLKELGISHSKPPIILDHFTFSMDEKTNFHFMTSRFQNYRFASLDSYDILELPYEQSSDYAFSMYIFLSHAKTGLKDLVAEFNSDPAALLPMNAHLENEELEQVSIPKTKLSHDFDAKEGMKAKRLTNSFFFLAGPLTMYNVASMIR